MPNGRSENFKQAAARHWRAAEYLTTKGCLENADHLYGLAAECAVKSVLTRFRTGIPKEHIDKLWDQGGLFPLQKAYPQLSSWLKTTNPFSNWEIDQRYLADGYVNEPAVEKHRNAARRLLGVTGHIGAGTSR